MRIRFFIDALTLSLFRNIIFRRFLSFFVLGIVVNGPVFAVNCFGCCITSLVKGEQQQNEY